MSRIYLDNNATTPLHPDVLAALDRALRVDFGNPSSIHQEGQSARHLLEEARERVARRIGATSREVVFTSSGTESSNAAIFGAVPAGRRCHIVTSGIEHPSVAEAIAELGRRGCEVSVVPPSRDGVVDAERMIAAIRDDTALVTLMMANNETGVVQPVAAVGRVCRERGIHFHCDAVQAAGKIPVDVAEIGCDTLALSAHKLHAPKGIGALFVRRGVTLHPLLVGGAQERRRRAGTENVPLAVAFGVAASLPDESERVRELRDRFESLLDESFEVTINGRGVARLPNTSSVTFEGADAEGLVIALDLDGVAVSAGSACSSGRLEPSPVLLAMGLTPQQARSTIRVSLSRFTTEEEIERVISILRRVVPRAAGRVASQS
jgi:cysteine desulfurase